MSLCVTIAQHHIMKSELFTVVIGATHDSKKTVMT